MFKDFMLKILIRNLFYDDIIGLQRVTDFLNSYRDCLSLGGTDSSMVTLEVLHGIKISK